jgi:hypothetical protein
MYVPNPTEHSQFWEANSSSASHNISGILRDPKVRRDHNSPPRVPFLGQMNPVYALASCFLKIHFNIFLPFTFRRSMCSLTAGSLLPQNLHASLPSHSCHKPQQPQPPRLVRSNDVKITVAARSEARVCGRSFAGNTGSNADRIMDVSLVLSCTGLCDGLITRPEKCYRVWCV